MDIELHNHQQIEQLNQRGGRTLTVVDLVRAGTLSVPMAAYAMAAIERGASIITGARPSGTGKTTLLAALLHLLPPGIPIITVDSPDVIAEGLGQPASQSAVYLAHEIGPGRWYGYIWGRQVVDFLCLAQGQRRIATCLHADDLADMVGILTSPPINASKKLVARIDLALFMVAQLVDTRYRRRVSYFYEADGRGGHRLVFRWDRATDSFEQQESSYSPEALEPYRAFIEELVSRSAPDAISVRRKVVEFYRSRAR